MANGITIDTWESASECFGLRAPAFFVLLIALLVACAGCKDARSSYSSSQNALSIPYDASESPPDVAMDTMDANGEDDFRAGRYLPVIIQDAASPPLPSLPSAYSNDASALLSEFLERATGVAIAKCIAKSSRYQSDGSSSSDIVTDYRFDIEETLSGTPLEQVTLPGGEVGDAASVYYETPFFYIGSTYLIIYVMGEDGVIVSKSGLVTADGIIHLDSYSYSREDVRKTASQHAQGIQQ